MNRTEMLHLNMLKVSGAAFRKERDSLIFVFWEHFICQNGFSVVCKYFNTGFIHENFQMDASFVSVKWGFAFGVCARFYQAGL